MVGRRTYAATKKCYVSTIHNAITPKQVQWVEVLDLVVLEDIGEPDEKKAIEDLVTMPLNKNGARFFMPGSSFNESEREEMFQFLKQNIEVFA